MRSSSKKNAYLKPKISRKKLVVNLSKNSMGKGDEMMLLAKVVC